MSDFIFKIIWLTLWQIAIIFGGLFIFGTILSKLQKWTQKNYHRSVGVKGILWTAWLGTPIHELSHALAAKMFFHKITGIKLFQPNFLSGELGQVSHRWNEKSIFQNIGNFFIGLAPMIFGSIILSCFLYFLVPNGREIFASLTVPEYSIEAFLKSGLSIFKKMFEIGNIKKFEFWLFLYVSFCIASHMSPSSQDKKGILHGLIFIVSILLLCNFFAIILQIDFTKYILNALKFFSIFTSIFFYAVVISFLHFFTSLIILLLFRK